MLIYHNTPVVFILENGAAYAGVGHHKRKCLHFSPTCAVTLSELFCNRFAKNAT